jgi:hypothetical protein
MPSRVIFFSLAHRSTGRVMTPMRAPSPDRAEARLAPQLVRESRVSGGRGFIHGNDDAEVN